jgi:hypothetical protein
LFYQNLWKHGFLCANIGEFFCLGESCPKYCLYQELSGTALSNPYTFWDHSCTQDATCAVGIVTQNYKLLLISLRNTIRIPCVYWGKLGYPYLSKFVQNNQAIVTSLKSVFSPPPRVYAFQPSFPSRQAFFLKPDSVRPLPIRTEETQHGVCPLSVWRIPVPSY